MHCLIASSSTTFTVYPSLWVLPDETLHRICAGISHDITKNHVAALVVQLAEKGTLSLEDPVQKWLPLHLNLAQSTFPAQNRILSLQSNEDHERMLWPCEAGGMTRKFRIQSVRPNPSPEAPSAPRVSRSLRWSALSGRRVETPAAIKMNL
jgi:hypothetical protein